MQSARERERGRAYRNQGGADLRQGMKLPVTLDQGEDGYIIAECPVLPGCISQGKTEEEALANIKDAIEGILELRRKRGLPEVRLSEVEVPV
ncbi:MAG: hypothetical protein DDT27_01469 [Dehalococcoidia bacterium]|nr:hypothetical protein [Chloroflexota bacterium]MBT9162904.1 hypothetical protein [Chloroflexota bacterium]